MVLNVDEHDPVGFEASRKECLDDLHKGKFADRESSASVRLSDFPPGRCFVRCPSTVASRQWRRSFFGKFQPGNWP